MSGPPIGAAPSVVRRLVAVSLYLLFVAAVSVICYKRPVAGDFDRYIYEALVRSRQQSTEAIYPIVKHENPRAEASQVLDSPQHLGQLEPLYAIRPLYVDAIRLARAVSPSIQLAINLVSAASLFGIGLVLLLWTKRPLYCALVMASPAIVVLGRIGTPDALAALCLIAAVWAVTRNQLFAAALLLLTSVWIRTDNILFVIAMLGLMAFLKKIPMLHSLVLAAVAGSSVLVINRLTGNYGWRVLFRYSFIGGRSPAEIVPHLTIRQYMHALTHGLGLVGGQELTIWLLLGLTAWHWLPRTSIYRHILSAAGLAALARFLLFPTPENRYFAWAYLIVGVAFIQTLTARQNTTLSPESSISD